MRITLTALLAALLVFEADYASATCLHGINLSGAEFGVPGGIVDKDYTFPSEHVLDYFAGKGFNIVRLPFLWERLQPVLGKPLDPDELARITATVEAARRRGMAIILDPHNYARYQGNLIGSDAVQVKAFADFWARLARN